MLYLLDGGGDGDDESRQAGERRTRRKVCIVSSSISNFMINQLLTGVDTALRSYIVEGFF